MSDGKYSGVITRRAAGCRPRVAVYVIPKGDDRVAVHERMSESVEPIIFVDADARVAASRLLDALDGGCVDAVLRGQLEWGAFFGELAHRYGPEYSPPRGVRTASRESIPLDDS